MYTVLYHTPYYIIHRFIEFFHFDGAMNVVYCTKSVDRLMDDKFQCMDLLCEHQHISIISLITNMKYNNSREKKKGRGVM